MTQLQIDFNWLSWRRVFENSEIPRTAQGVKLKCSTAVLRVVADKIDTFCGMNEWGWPSVATLCDSTGYKPRTIQLAIRDLKLANLLEFEFRFVEGANGRRQTSNKYRLKREIWYELPRIKTAKEGDGIKTAAASRGIKTTRPDQTRAVPDSDASAPPRARDAPPAQTVRPPAHDMRPGGASAARGGRMTCAPEYHSLNHQVNHQNKTHEDDVRKPVKERSPFGGWPHAITREELRIGQSVLVLYEHAVAKRWLGNSEDDRLMFFAFCRRTAICAETPGKFLTTGVKTRNFKCVKNEDLDAAAGIIKRLIHAEPQARLANLDEPADDEPWRRRDEQIRRLRESTLCQPE